MGKLARSRFTFPEYVALEETSPIRHEYLDGVVYALAGGSPDHAAVAANVIRLLGNALEGRPCRVYTADLRVRVVETGLGTYPDASVICDRFEADLEDPKGHTAINPTVLVEVLSPSTEAYDRGEKLDHYRRIPSLREVLHIAHDVRRVELWRRGAGDWTLTRFEDGEQVPLESLGCSIGVTEIYRDPLSG